MVERSEQQDPFEFLSPAERNQELRKIFEAVPRTSVIRPEEGMNVGAMIRLRENSDARQQLSNNLQSLLRYSFLTPSAKTYLIYDFEDLYVTGTRESVVDHNPDLVERGEILQWENQESDGIFAEISVRPVEARLYKKAVKRQMTHLIVKEWFHKDQRMNEILKRVAKEKFLQKVSEELLTDDERVELEEQQKEEAEYADKIEQRWADRQILMERWREEYLERYHDEP